jgi:hypothetical protein
MVYVFLQKRIDLLLRGQTDIISLQFNIKAFKFGFPPNKLHTKSMTEVNRKIRQCVSATERRRAFALSVTPPKGGFLMD